MDNSLEQYLTQLEDDIKQKNDLIIQHQNKANQLLVEAANHTEQPPTPQKIPQKVQKSPKQPQQNSQITHLAQKLGELGVEPEILQNLGQDAELSYLKTRVNQLLKIQNQLQLDYQNSLSNLKTAKEDKLFAENQLNSVKNTIEKLRKQTAQQAQTNEKLTLRNQELEAIQQDLEKKNTGNSKLAQQTVQNAELKEKRLRQALEQIDKLKQQLSETVENGQLQREKMAKTQQNKDENLLIVERERDELLNIVKKQQNLIDVLQRQKLHLQGAIQLGFNEQEFQKIIE